MLHLNGPIFWELGDYRKPLKYDEFLKEPGKKVALPITGGASQDRSLITKQMERHGISVLPALEVDSEQMHWSLLYRPETREVIVDNRRLQEAISYSPLPEIGKEKTSNKYQHNADGGQNYRGGVSSKPAPRKNWTGDAGSGNI